MAVLQFIEERFRMGIRILQTDIDNYYQKTMIPRVREGEHAAA